MAYFAYVSLENVPRELVSRDLDAENGDVLMLADYQIGESVELEDWDIKQDCIFKRTADGWRQTYAATWPMRSGGAINALVDGDFAGCSVTKGGRRDG